jgi:predicted RNase H-like nuclease
MAQPISRNVFLFGLDLAWGARNPSGAVVLRPEAGGYRANDPETLGGDRAIIDWVTRESSGSALAVLAIDAPLFAPNAPGTSRSADITTSKLYGRFNASVYPANRERCARPIALATELLRHGWTLCPFALRDEVATAHSSGRQPSGRFAIEVYPHAACVGLFGLPRKKGSIASRRSGLTDLQSLLHERMPMFDEGVAPPIDPFAHADISSLRGRALKAHEDRLDALLCAAMAAAFVHAPDRCVIAGANTPADVCNGYIVVPIPPPKS